MAIQAYNLATRYSLQIKPDFIADLYADIDNNNKDQYAGKYVLVRELDNQIFYVQNNLNGTYSILPAYDLDNYTIDNAINKVVYNEIDIVPGATEVAFSFVPTDNITLVDMQITGDGDCIGNINLDNDRIGNFLINWQNPNIIKEFDIGVMSGKEINININCRALETSTFGVTLTYR